MTSQVSKVGQVSRLLTTLTSLYRLRVDILQTVIAKMARPAASRMISVLAVRLPVRGRDIWFVRFILTLRLNFKDAGSSSSNNNNTTSTPAYT